MGRTIIDLTDQQFGRLTVTELAGSDRQNKPLWLCRCICGNDKIVASRNLKLGNVRSCGCLRDEMFRAMSKIFTTATHGHCRNYTDSPEYESWTAMKSRCLNPNASRYERYGGIGVTVCDRWKSFATFLADMGERPEGTTLGRILDMGDYEPGNAFWQTKDEQRLARLNKRALLRSNDVPNRETNRGNETARGIADRAA